MGWEAIAVRVRAGDRDAFAELYDELAGRVYGLCLTLLRDRDEAADAMHDVFVVAVQRIGQLRDPSRLVPWVFAIARHLCFRRLEQRRRALPVGEPQPEGTLDLADGVDADDVSAVVWAAAAGLNERDRTLLYLNTTQGLDGEELAAAVGIVHANPYSLLHRAKQQLRRAIDVLYVAKVGRSACPTLDGMLDHWDGALTPLLRKRIGRHLDHCATCEHTKSRAQSSAAVAAALSATAAHADTLTAADVLDIAARRPAPTEPWQPDGFPPPIETGDRRRRRLVVVLTASAVGALLLAGLIGMEQGRAHPAKPAVHVLDAHTQRHAKQRAPRARPGAATTTAPAPTTAPGTPAAAVTTVPRPTLSITPNAPAIAIAPPVTTVTPKSTSPATSPHPTGPPTTVRHSPPTTRPPAPPTTAPHPPPTTPPTTLPDTGPGTTTTLPET